MVELARRDFGTGALLSGLVAAAPRIPVRAAPSAPLSDERLLAAVNPELREFARPMLAWRTAPPLSQTYRDIRKQAASDTAPLPDIPVAKETIPVSAGGSTVTIYVINAGGMNRPAMRSLARSSAAMIWCSRLASRRTVGTEQLMA